MKALLLMLALECAKPANKYDEAAKKAAVQTGKETCFERYDHNRNKYYKIGKRVAAGL